MRSLAVPAAAMLSRCHRSIGEVPERSNGAVSKTVVRLRVPRVRIPPSPPGVFFRPHQPPSISAVTPL